MCTDGQPLRGLAACIDSRYVEGHACLVRASWAWVADFCIFVFAGFRIVLSVEDEKCSSVCALGLSLFLSVCLLCAYCSSLRPHTLVA